MVGLVLVSHSRALAVALQEMVDLLYADKVPIAVAAGAGDEHQDLGTDAMAIMAAIEEVAGEDGALVLLDLGSAVLSAETALDFLDEPLRSRVAICSAPLVEGAIAAAAQSSIGAPLADVRREAENALRQKVEHLGSTTAKNSAPSPAKPASGPALTATFRVENAHGLHARPAMRIVQAVGRLESSVEIENLRTGAPPAPARSLVAINCLDVRQGDSIRVTAIGPDASSALAAIAELHAARFGDPPDTPPGTPVPIRTDPGSTLRGQSLSGGVALGQIVFATRRIPELPIPAASIQSAAEIARLRGALASVRQQLAESAEAVGRRLGGATGAILEAHQMLLSDPALGAAAIALIENERLPAAQAWQRASEAVAESYRRLGEPMRARARDIEDLGLQVLRELGINTALQLDLPAVPCVLAISTLLPTEAAGLEKRYLRGVIAEAIGPTSHAAILLRAAGLPALDGVSLSQLREAVDPAAATNVAFDGATGEIWLAPDGATLAALEKRRPAIAPAPSAAPPPPAYTRDGRRIEIAANVASLADAAAAAAAGAEAIGLLRTEFLFFDRAEPPTEDEQADALRAIAAALPAEAPITVRTFDIGGDKPVPYLPGAPEANPFLGVRGIRLALRRRDLFLAHLRAILRAAHGRRFRIMLPMVTEVDEVRRARALLAQAHGDLHRKGKEHAWPIDTGIMIEVPAAALNARALAAEVDFFSVGTNDLTQYTLAAERGHPQLTGLADALHPAVLRLVGHAAAAAARRGKWTGVCGEAAADPFAATVFVGLGVTELSAGAASVPQLREAVCALDYRAARALALRCLAASSAAEVRALGRSE